MEPNCVADVLLRRRAQDQLSARFIAARGDVSVFSYASLHDRALTILGNLQRKGAKKGDIVILSIEQPEHFFGLLWACFLGGLVASPVAPATGSPAKVDFIRNIWKMCDEPLIVCDGAAAQIAAATAADRVIDMALLAGSGIAGMVAKVVPDDPALLPFTSGSTGVPKGIVLTNSNILAMVRGTAAMNGFSETDHCLNWMPLEHPGAAVFLGILPAFLGASQTHVKTGLILADPILWLRLMTEYQTAVSWAPNFAFSMVSEAIKTEDLSGLSLKDLRFLVNAGEQVKSTTVLEFLNSLAPLGLREGALRPAFGMAESCSGITWSSGLTRRVLEGNPAFISLGKAIPGAKLRIVDDAGNLQPEGVSGQLEMQGPSVTKGYFGNPEGNALAFTNDGWFRTGDTAYLSADELYVTGRTKDDIVLNGQNIPFHVIEKTVEAVDGVLAAHTCAFAASSDHNPTERLRVAFCCVKGRDADVHRIGASVRRVCATEFGAQGVEVICLAAKDLPRTAIGKIQRKQLKENYLSGSLSEKIVRIETVGAGTRRTLPLSGLEGEIAAIWQTTLQIAKVGRGDNFFDLGGQSILLIRMHKHLVERFGNFPLSELFMHPTVEAQARFLGRKATSGAARPDKMRRIQVAVPVRSTSRAVAVIGMACRFPGSDTPDEFWQNLLNKVESISQFSVQDAIDSGVDGFLAADKNYVRSVPKLRDAAAFDAGFFGYSDREAALLDPQQRIFLAVAWEVFESAGYDPQKTQGRVGVYAGAAMNTYFVNNVLPNLSELDARAGLDVFTLDSMAGFQAMVANDKDYLATRVSYKLGLEGPSINLQTACSSGLVVIHQAINSILSGDCSMALAGTASVQAPVDVGHLYREGMIVSKDGKCRAFDAEASGTIFGSGVGAVLLKRLDAAVEDGDNIIAVIKGSAVNNDGRRKVGYMAPSQDGETEVTEAAFEWAGISADTIGLVEAHGTGTLIGDPIEVASLAQAFNNSSGRTQFCALGAVKTNLGHLQISSGIAGFMKAALAVQTGQIPANLHYAQPNPQIDFAASPFFIPTETTDWPLANGPRRASVNSLGIGGTNAHVVLEEPPARQSPARSAEAEIILLSARDAEDFGSAAARLKAALPGDLADLSFTLATGRHRFACRRALVVDAENPLSAALDGLCGVTTGDPSGLVFAFTGQGAQCSGMSLGLYRDQPEFRRHLDACAGHLVGVLDRPLLDLLASDEAVLADTAVTQPVLFAVEYALARFWMACGLTPAALIGHSLGEYVAATLAGVFSLESALRLVAARGRAMAAQAGDGAMLAVMLDADALAPQLVPHPDLQIAARNSSGNTVVSGPRAQIAALEVALKASATDCRPVATSRAFHSRMMAGAAEEFGKVLETVVLAEPQIPLVSNLTGQIESDLFSTRDYWLRHMLEPVEFRAGVESLFAGGLSRFLEVGPHPVLSGFIRAAGGEAVETLRKGRSDLRQTLQAMACLFEAGYDLDLAPLYEGRGCRRVPLPTYPFKNTRHWLKPKPRLLPSASPAILHPLVHRRVPLPGLDLAVYETDLATPHPDWVNDHIVQGRPLVAGAAHLAMLATAARLAGQAGPHLTDISFVGPLFADQPRVMQLRLGRATAEVFSYPPKGEGSVHHVTARIGAGGLPESPEWSVNLGPRSDAISGASLRQRLADRQIALGPSYGWLQTVAHDRDHATYSLAPPPGMAVDPAMGLHPGLVDSLLQPALMLLAMGAADETFVPVAMERFALHLIPEAYPLTGAMRRRPGAGQIVDLCIRDAQGRVVVTVDGFELRRLAPRDDLADALVQVVWTPVALGTGAWDRPSPAACLAGPAVHDDAFQAIIAAVSGPRALQRTEDLEELAIAYLTEAFVTAGALPAPSQTVTRPEIARRLNLAEDFTQALDRLLGLLVRHGRLLPAGHDRWQGVALLAALPAKEQTRRIRAKYGPAIESELALLESAGSRLTSILCGATDPLEALFPGGDLSAATALYRDSAGFSVLNTLVGRLVGDIGAAAPSDHVLRVLEIGAGTGATTHHVLPHLAPGRSVYVFTDISNLFLKNARDSFVDFPFLDYRIFDVEKDPAGQGLSADFDLVIASNVLHATASIAETLDHVRGLLRPGGHLVLLEVNEPTVPVDLTFGLLKGWWRFRDRDLRPNYPLLSRTQWLAALRTAGFASVEAADLELPTPGGLQTVFVAQMPQGSEVAGNLALVGADHLGLGSALQKAGVRVGSGGKPDATVLLAQGARDAEVLRQLALAGQGGPIHVVTDDNGDSRTLWGLMRVLRREMPDRAGRILSIAPGVTAGQLADAVLSADLPDEVSLAPTGCRSFTLAPLRTPLPDPVAFDPEGAYLITGGMGGIGLRLAAAMVARGAQHIALVGRSRRETSELADLLRHKGVTAHLADVADKAAMAAIIAQLTAKRPLRGVFHLAGVLQPALLGAEDHLLQNIAAKVEGAAVLDQLCADQPGLEHFVLFSSAAAWFGLPGQGAYAAGNAGLDALALRRRARGQPALAVNWGRWADVGMVGAGDHAAAIRPDAGIALLFRLMATDLAQVGVLPGDWRHEAGGKAIAVPTPKPAPSTALAPVAAATGDTLDYLTRQIGRLLGGTVPPETGRTLTELGLDSLMCIDLRARIADDLGVRLALGAMMETPVLTLSRDIDAARSPQQMQRDEAEVEFLI